MFIVFIYVYSIASVLIFFSNYYYIITTIIIKNSTDPKTQC